MEELSEDMDDKEGVVEDNDVRLAALETELSFSVCLLGLFLFVSLSAALGLEDFFTFSRVYT